MSISRIRPEPRAAGRTGGMYAGFLPCVPDPAFCVVHLPDGTPTGHGIVFCPPLAWADLCTHRVRRHWAQALTQAGHSAVRLDLPGTEDSLGTSTAPHRVSAWVEAINTAARWLIDEAGCTRITGLGIGFGGMLAWMAAAADSAIDDLILWATPLSGRRVVRELRTASKLNVDWTLPSELSETADAETIVDESGLPMTPETLDELSRLDLTTLDLGEPSRRRVLLLVRPGDHTDTALHELLVGAGIELAVEDGSELTGIMQYAAPTVPPTAAIESSRRWLESSRPSHAETSPELSSSLPDVIELKVGGVAIRERLVTLDLPSGQAQAILTERVEPAVSDHRLTAVFISAASDRRTGPNRLWVQTARRWAALGLVAARVDPPGVGEASGDERSWEQRWGMFSGAKVAEERQIIRALRAHGLPARVVLVGFCSGSFRALRTALADREVAGMLLVGLPAVSRLARMTLVRDDWISQTLGSGAHSGRVTAGLSRLGRQVFELSGRMSARVAATLRPGRTTLQRQLLELTKRHTEVLMVLRDGDVAAEQLRSPHQPSWLSGRRHLSVKLLPSNDPRFRPFAAQLWVTRQLDEALDRVLATGRIDRHDRESQPRRNP